MKNVKVRGKRRKTAEKDEFRGGKGEFRGKFRGSARKNPNSAAQLEIPQSAENCGP